MMELLSGAKEGLVHYNGRPQPEPRSNMGNGECGVFLSSSAYIGNLTRASEGKVQRGRQGRCRACAATRRQLDHRGRHAVGAQGRQAEEYKGVAQFFKYLASTDSPAARWAA